MGNEMLMVLGDVLAMLQQERPMNGQIFVVLVDVQAVPQQEAATSQMTT